MKRPSEEVLTFSDHDGVKHLITYEIRKLTANEQVYNPSVVLELLAVVRCVYIATTCLAACQLHPPASVRTEFVLRNDNREDMWLRITLDLNRFLA